MCKIIVGSDKYHLWWNKNGIAPPVIHRSCEFWRKQCKTGAGPASRWRSACAPKSVLHYFIVKRNICESFLAPVNFWNDTVPDSYKFVYGESGTRLARVQRHAGSTKCKIIIGSDKYHLWWNKNGIAPPVIHRSCELWRKQCKTGAGSASRWLDIWGKMRYLIRVTYYCISS